MNYLQDLLFLNYEFLKFISMPKKTLEIVYKLKGAALTDPISRKIGYQW